MHSPTALLTRLAKRHPEGTYTNIALSQTYSEQRGLLGCSVAWCEEHLTFVREHGSLADVSRTFRCEDLATVQPPCVVQNALTRQ